MLSRLLIGSLFVVTGLVALLFKFDGFVGMVARMGLPGPATLWAYAALLLKVVAGAALIAGIRRRQAAWALIAFTLVSLWFFHNPLDKPAELTNAMKNVAIVGGLLMFT